MIRVVGPRLCEFDSPEPGVFINSTEGIFIMSDGTPTPKQSVTPDEVLSGLEKFMKLGALHGYNPSPHEFAVWLPHLETLRQELGE